MKEAYKCKSADKARKRLQALVSWLERNGYDEAAGSLREGMEETLTVVKLALPALLRQSLATTNAIENLNGTIRRVSRNVKRWKSPSMVRRWTALGVVTAQKEPVHFSRARSDVPSRPPPCPAYPGTACPHASQNARCSASCSPASPGVLHANRRTQEQLTRQRSVFQIDPPACQRQVADPAHLLVIAPPAPLPTVRAHSCFFRLLSWMTRAYRSSNYTLQSGTNHETWQRKQRADRLGIFHSVSLS